MSDRDHQEDGASRCPGALHRKAPERPPVPGLLEACLCWRQSVPHWVEKITGGGVPAVSLPLGARARRGLTDTELVLSRAREPRREIWRSQVPNLRDGVPECSKASFGLRSVSPEPVPMSQAVVFFLLGWLWLTEGSVGFWFLQRKPCACQIVGSELELAAGPLAGEAASPVLPVSSLPFPSQASPPTGVLPQWLGPPPLPYLFMVHTCLLPRRICERRSSLVGNKCVMRECE